MPSVSLQQRADSGRSDARRSCYSPRTKYNGAVLISIDARGKFLCSLLKVASVMPVKTGTQKLGIIVGAYGVRPSTIEVDSYLTVR